MSSRIRQLAKSVARAKCRAKKAKQLANGGHERWIIAAKIHRLFSTDLKTFQILSKMVEEA